MKLRRLPLLALAPLIFLSVLSVFAFAKEEPREASKEIQRSCDLAIGGFVDNKLASDEILCVWYGECQEKKGCLMGLYDAKNDRHSDLFENGSFFGGLNEPCSKVAVMKALHLPKTSYAIGATPNSDISVWMYYQNLIRESHPGAVLRVIYDRYGGSKELGLPFKAK